MPPRPQSGPGPRPQSGTPSAASNAGVKFSDDELKAFRLAFAGFDRDGTGSADSREVQELLSRANETFDEKQLDLLIAEVDKDGEHTVDFAEFLAIISCLRTGEKASSVKALARMYDKQKNMVQVTGLGGGLHSFAEEEIAAFSAHMNRCLSRDPDCSHLIPISTEGLDLCVKIKDGILLAKLINLAVPDTIDERALNKVKDGKELSVFKMNENLNLVISSAKAIGCQTVNLGSTELSNGEDHPHLVLGLIWQLVKLQLLNSINLKSHPQLVRLLEPGEDLADLKKLTPDQLLLRWFNYHLDKQGSTRRVHNFGPDVADSECYTILLNSIDPSKCDRAGLNERDLHKRAGHVLRNAGNLGVDFLIAENDICTANPKLNLAFTAAVFNCNPGLEDVTQDMLVGLDTDDDLNDSREERAFRMWMNSLGIDNLYVNNLYEDCSDGLYLLKVMDFVDPGCVDWEGKVEKKPNNRFKKLTNGNYAVQVGKTVGFSLVGIGGVDIVGKNKKLILAIVWQLMRRHTIKFLGELFSGGQINEEKIIEWANKTVHDSGRTSSMRSFKDDDLCTSHFFFDLLNAVDNRVINWDLVTPASNEEEAILNARYAISVARKLNCTIFLLPEDIVEVKDKMILTFVASIMAVALARRAGSLKRQLSHHASSATPK